MMGFPERIDRSTPTLLGEGDAQVVSVNADTKPMTADKMKLNLTTSSVPVSAPRGRDLV